KPTLTAASLGDRLNQQLQPQGVNATVVLDHNIVNILLEAEQAPDEAAMVTRIKQELTQFNLATIEKVTVYGQPSAAAIPAWSEEFQP
ncbi:MAG TPA: hypothetical protein V6C65_18965, partial [Allocoleopsis sp.]